MTVVSLVYILMADGYFYFSAFIPLLVFSVANLYAAYASDPMLAVKDGVMPEAAELLEEIGATTWLAVGAVIALVILAVYFICWLVSKKHPAAMVVAACFYAIDCVVLLLCFDATFIVDLLFHAWVMFCLIQGIVSWRKLKKLPPEEAAPVEVPFTVINGEPIPSAVPTQAPNEASFEHEPPSDRD